MKSWLIPTGLIGLGLIPAVAGSLRLAEFAGGTAVLSDGDRIGSAPVPVVLHIISVTVFSMLGAFQFAPRFRRRRRRWHRVAGRIVAPAGLVAALSGLWLTLFLPPLPLDSHALVAIRVLVAAGMCTFLVLGFGAVRRRDFTRHRAWMIRGYALGLGAGTQAFTNAAWLIAFGELTVLGRTSTLAAGWLINMIVAEWIIRRRRTVRPAGTAGSPGPRPPRAVRTAP